MSAISTPITKMFGIDHPIMLAGMNVAAGPRLAAAVTNAGGLGVIGGLGYTPKMLRKQIAELKKDLNDKNAPFGVDLLLPKVGKGARATNYDYTKGNLPGLIDIIIESGCKLFVCAVGVPPKWAVEKLHAAKIPVMNMIGAPKHVKYALAAGVDIICAQGGEGGGHTGSIPTSLLIPKVADLCKNAKSPLTGKKVSVVAAGGIYDGRGLAMSLALGADAVWVGTRFVACTEASASKRHKNGVVACDYTNTVRTIIFTGRPLRVKNNTFIESWLEKPEEIKKLTTSGIIPVRHQLEQAAKNGTKMDKMDRIEAHNPLLMGQVAGAIDKVLSAKEIVDEMVGTASQVIAGMNSNLQSRL